MKARKDKVYLNDYFENVLLEDTKYLEHMEKLQLIDIEHHPFQK